MSRNHPVVAVTGSSGAGTSNVKRAFEHIFRIERLRAAVVEGDSYHRYDRETMDKKARRAKFQGKRLTHFGPEGNLFEELEKLFRLYGENGRGRRRHYIHNEEEAAEHGQSPGTLTAWESLPEDTDLLLYEGLHGGVVTDKVDVRKHVDLLIGVAPIINLEWIQKICRDQAGRGYSADDATQMILSRMYDYVHYILPQFSLTDINFQRLPTIDTSNPFAMESIPTDEQSLWIIHIRNPRRIGVDYEQLLKMI
ncbi:MAG: phosphoribulokinase, partial [Gammaproteobacteria bacterium]